MINNTFCNVEPSEESASRVFPLLPYCKKNLQLLKEYQFQDSGFNDSGSIQFCTNLVESKNC